MAASTSRELNFNIGVLGHVDSGKTSLGMYSFVRTILVLWHKHHTKHFHLIMWERFTKMSCLISINKMQV